MSFNYDHNPPPSLLGQLLKKIIRIRKIPIFPLAIGLFIHLASFDESCHVFQDILAVMKSAILITELH